MPNVAVTFASDNPAIATVDAVQWTRRAELSLRRSRATVPGTNQIRAAASEGETTSYCYGNDNSCRPATPVLVVINQIYGGGNNSGATFQNDFVELFNRGTTTVDFSATPYSVQYASASGTFTNANKLNLITGSLAPGQYFLVRLAGGTTNGVLLPAADAASNAINLSAADGKVALVKGTTLLAGNGCPLGAMIADFVGYGAANCAEGHSTSALNATRSARRINSCIDTDSNSTDFSVVTNPALPRNSATTPVPCL